LIAYRIEHSFEGYRLLERLYFSTIKKKLNNRNLILDLKFDDKN